MSILGTDTGVLGLDTYVGPKKPPQPGDPDYVAPAPQVSPVPGTAAIPGVTVPANTPVAASPANTMPVSQIYAPIAQPVAPATTTPAATPAATGLRGRAHGGGNYYSAGGNSGGPPRWGGGYGMYPPQRGGGYYGGGYPPQGGGGYGYPPQGGYGYPQQGGGGYQYSSQSSPYQGWGNNQGSAPQGGGGYQGQQRNSNYQQQSRDPYSSSQGGGYGGGGGGYNSYRPSYNSGGGGYNGGGGNYGGYNGGSQYRPNQPAGGPSWQANGRGYARGGVVGFAQGGVPNGINVGAPPPPVGPYPSTAFNPMNNRDVYDQNQGIGQNTYATEQAWLEDHGNQSQYYGGNEQQGGQLVNNLYSDIWNGGGGYNDQQMGNVVQQGGLDDINNELSSNYMTGDEEAGVRGDPYSTLNMYKGQADALGNASNAAGDDLRAQATSGEDKGNAVVNQYRSDLSSAIDPSKLSLSSGFKPGLDSRLATGQAGLTAAESNPDLTPTDEYKRQAGMSDAEVAEAAGAGQRGVATQYGALRDKLIQDTTAAGGGSPMQIASALGMFNRDQAAQESEAAVNAKLAARQQQIAAATGVQNTVGQMGQYRSNLQSSDALSQEGQGIAADTTAEQMRLGAQQALTQQQMTAAQLQNTAALNNVQNNVANAMGASTQAGNWGLDTSKFNATNEANLMQTAESNASQRNQALAQNRQGVNQYNQGMQFNTNNAASNRYQAAYQPWVNAQTEGRTAAVNERNYYGNQKNTQDQLALGGAGTFGGQTQNAANAYQQWGAGERDNGGVAGAVRTAATIAGIVTGGTNAASNARNAGLFARGGTVGGDDVVDGDVYKEGGLIDHNQLIEVGEHDRPEAILPLDPATPPEGRNQWERMGAELGRHLGVHHHRPYRRGVLSDHLSVAPKHFMEGGNTNPSWMNSSNNGGLMMGGSNQGGAPGAGTPPPGSGINIPNLVPEAPLGMVQPSALPTLAASPPTPFNNSMLAAPATQNIDVSRLGVGGEDSSGGIGAPTSGGGAQAMQLPPTPSMSSQQAQPYQRRKSMFDLDAQNPFIENELAQQAAAHPGMRRGGLIGQGSKWRMRMPPGVHMPQIRAFGV